VRLIGVGVSGLSEKIERQMHLPLEEGGAEEREEKRRRARRALDDIKRKMGPGTIDRGDIS